MCSVPGDDHESSRYKYQCSWPGWLWIDQICIDQGSHSERNHEVQRMSAIYSNATRTVVWLGHAADDSDEGMQIIATITGTYKRLPPRPKFAGHLYQRVRYIKQLHRGHDLGLANLSKIFERPYWRRLGVV